MISRREGACRRFTNALLMIVASVVVLGPPGRSSAQSFPCVGNPPCAPGYPVIAYQDLDADGYGAEGAVAECCSGLSVGYAGNNADCNDFDPQTNPGATDFCGDAIDQNCDGTLNDGCPCGAACDTECAAVAPGDECMYLCNDETAGCTATSCGVYMGINCCQDFDGDGEVGYHSIQCASGLDCNDYDITVNTSAIDVCGDSVDNDCDGTVDNGCGCVDNDGDLYPGYAPLSCPAGTDCDDTRVDVYPTAPELCDGVDNNCDTVVDEGCAVCSDGDGDGFDGYHVTNCPAGTDCDDTDPTIYPGAPDTCGDAIDSNCDGTDGGVEVCDNADNDCDGLIDDGADGSCLATEACVWGGCYDTCATSTDCAGAESCYASDYVCNQTTDPCANVTCPGVKVCHQGHCYDPCVDNGDCTPPNVCFDGRCAETACEGVQCPVEQLCHNGECYDSCTTGGDCAGEPCQTYETCTDGTCDNYCATDPCAGVQCEVGPPAEICHLGSCYDPCGTDGDCTPPNVCFDGRCVDENNPCDGIHCGDGQTCHMGECYDSCSFDAECDPANEMCFKGSCISTSCTVDTCPGSQVCHQGVCYDPCASDGDCAPPNVCFDGRCARDACEALIPPDEYDYHVNHPFTRTGRWVTARQPSTPKLYPMPVETSDPGAWTTGANPVQAVQRARLALLFDPTAVDADNPEGRYVLWLTQGADDAAQGEGRASYTVRWVAGVDAAQIDVTPQDSTKVAVGSAGGGKGLHQILVDNAAGQANGVLLGYLPGSLDATVRIDADFSGDLQGWEIYNGDTGWVVPLNAWESLTLRIQPSGDPGALITPMHGRACIPVDDPNAQGVCSRGALDRCRNGELFCLSSVTPWAHEGCDGRDNNCDGYVDEPDTMHASMVYVRQPGNPSLESWVRIATDDRASNVIDALNFQPIGGDPRAGRANYRYNDGTPMQVTDGMRLLFHRDMRDGAVTMPLLFGSDEASVAVRNLPEKVAVEVALTFDAMQSYADQVYLTWWDERADLGSLKAEVVPAQADPTLWKTESELKWVALGTTDTDPAQADADAFVWKSALKQAGTMGELAFGVEVTTGLSDLGIATVDGSVLPLIDARLEVRIEATPLSQTSCYDPGETGDCKYGSYTCSVGGLACEVSAAACACQDLDGDGADGYDPDTCPTGNDCDDTDASITPGGEEICDGIDNDCDGRADIALQPLDPAAPRACGETTPPGESCGPADCNYDFVCVCPTGSDCYCDGA